MEKEDERNKNNYFSDIITFIKQNNVQAVLITNIQLINYLEDEGNYSIRSFDNSGKTLLHYVLIY